VGDRTGRVHLWRLPSGTPAGTLVGTDRAVSCLATSTSGKWLASGHVDGTILVWRLTDRVLTVRLHYGGSLGRVMMPEGGSLAAVGPGGGFAKVWDFVGQKPKVVGSVIGQAVATPDGTLLAAGVLDGVQTWRLPTGTEDRLIPFQGSNATMLRALGDGKLLAGFGPGGHGVQLWRLPSGTAEGILANESQKSVDHLSAVADGNTIVTADSDDVVTLWRLWDGHLRALSQLPLADIDPAAIQRTERPAADLLSGERTWRELLTALARWRDHPRIAAYDRQWDPTDADPPDTDM
jgi:WD40 repeat protein